jgi:hypothetical protein
VSSGDPSNNPDALGSADGATSTDGRASADGGEDLDGAISGDAAGSDAAQQLSAQALLDKVDGCSGTALKGGFGLDGSGNISIYQCGSAVYWKADMDIDCDGIQTPPCDVDPQGQPQTSIVDLAPSGDVDPTLLPFFVIPLGSPETEWYTPYGIELGQVGAVIYNGQVEYGIFADQAGGWFIGEVSYAMCQLFLGGPSGGNDPCSPIDGGIDPAEITYVTFTGAGPRASGADIYDHGDHAAKGVAAATSWLAE